MYRSKVSARSAMSWRRVKPNLAKSKSIESTSLIAIGSSMTESGLRASVARTTSVSSAVSDTPVRSACRLALRHRNTLSSVRRLRVVVDDL